MARAAKGQTAVSFSSLSPLASRRARAIRRSRIFGLFLLAAFALSCIRPSLTSAKLLPAGSEFQLNTYTIDQQQLPAVAAAANGNFVVVWESFHQDGDYYGIFGHRYSSDGSPLGSEFQVDTFTFYDQRRPAVSAAPSGDFVVVWDSYYDGDGYGIFGQRYASNGTTLGTRFQLNTYTISNQTTPDVVAAADGNFVAVWESNGQDGNYAGVFGQRFASNGSQLGTEFRVNKYTVSDQSEPRVAAAPNGDFTVVWESSGGQDGSQFGVFGRRYASGGNVLGTEFQVNTYTQRDQYSPDIAVAVDGEFTVVWNSYGCIFGQRFSSSGAASGTEFQVNTYTLGALAPAVASDSAGNFVVVWTSYTQDGYKYGVFGQRYASSGGALDKEFQVNTYTQYNQRAPVIASANGNFVVVWQSNHQDGDYGNGVFGQRLSSPCAPTPLGGCASPGKSLLLIKDKSPAGASPGDKLIWKWLKGPMMLQTDFGNPATTAEYTLCVYAGAGQTLAMEASVSPLANWKTLGTTGYKYKDVAAATDGVFQILLKAGATAGSSKILVKGREGGLDLGASTLPFDGTANVNVQLHNSDNTNCWEKTFLPAAIKKNTAAEYKAKTP